MEGHASDCQVWDWVCGERLLNNALPCTCGFRGFVELDKIGRQAQFRATKPLGMSEDDWLRTLGIDPVR